jgi:hypothetical protein
MQVNWRMELSGMREDRDCRIIFECRGRECSGLGEDSDMRMLDIGMVSKLCRDFT